MKELLLIAIGSAIVNNVVLSQFLGICTYPPTLLFRQHLPWYLSVLRSFQENRDSSRNGRCSCVRYHDFLVCNSTDL